MLELKELLSAPMSATNRVRVVIIAAVRSPFCKANKGALKDVHADGKRTCIHSLPTLCNYITPITRIPPITPNTCMQSS